MELKVYWPDALPDTTEFIADIFSLLPRTELSTYIYILFPQMWWLFLFLKIEFGKEKIIGLLIPIMHNLRIILCGLFYTIKVYAQIIGYKKTVLLWITKGCTVCRNCFFCYIASHHTSMIVHTSWCEKPGRISEFPLGI